MSNTIVATLVSAPFAVAVTALLRRRWPAIDGAWVYAVVLALSVIGALVGHYASVIPPEVWAAIGPALTAILAVGGVQTAQDVASKAIVVQPDPAGSQHVTLTRGQP